jgi:catechol 2,3-dioxygenase-like lactoylglutathione lyase family enzyme
MTLSALCDGRIACDLSAMTTLTTRNFTAFLATRDREGAKRFYRDTLGFALMGDDPFALIFALHNGTLRISPVPNFTPHQFTALGWEVPDIEAAVKELVAAGVKFERFSGMEQDELGIWAAPGGPGVAEIHARARVAWFKDPDGNVLSVTQLPK